jgi:pimeloyl-ACP methyl ester carboxylesterase
MHKLDLGAVKLHYEELGEGAPLFLLAGFSNDVSWWHKTASFLKSSFRLILLDYRGGGKSVHSSPFTIRDLAEDTIKAMDLLGIKKATFVGHSMGGTIVQDLAAFFPERVSHICLVNSLSHLHPTTAFVLQTGLKFRENQVPGELVLNMTMPWGFSGEFLAHPQKIEEFKKFLLSLSKPATLEGLKHRLEAISVFDSRSYLKKITAKTLVIASKRDLLVPFTDTELLVQNIPHAKRFLIADEGHYPLWESPKSLASAIQTL